MQSRYASDVVCRYLSLTFTGRARALWVVTLIGSERLRRRGRWKLRHTFSGNGRALRPQVSEPAPGLTLTGRATTPPPQVLAQPY
jgi:hypothetical protein